MKGELGEAERILHEALRLSHQADNRKAIVYTYSMVGGHRCSTVPPPPRCPMCVWSVLDVAMGP